MSSYVEHRYLMVDTHGCRVVMAARPGSFHRRLLPLAGAVATLDDPGPRRRGWSLISGLMGAGVDAGTLFVSVRVGEQTEIVEIPRKHGARVREIVARINMLGARSSSGLTREQRRALDDDPDWQ